jgi:hypothetical protein
MEKKTTLTERMIMLIDTEIERVRHGDRKSIAD